MRLPPKMTHAQIPRRSGWRASGSASVRPGRAALSARGTNVRLQGKGLLLGLRSPSAAEPWDTGRSTFGPSLRRGRPESTNCVEKLRLIEAPCADSLLSGGGDSVDDGRAAGDAGGAVLWLQP